MWNHLLVQLVVTCSQCNLTYTHPTWHGAWHLDYPCMLVKVEIPPLVVHIASHNRASPPGHTSNRCSLSVLDKAPTDRWWLIYMPELFFFSFPPPFFADLDVFCKLWRMVYRVDLQLLDSTNYNAVQPKPAMAVYVCMVRAENTWNENQFNIEKNLYCFVNTSSKQEGVCPRSGVSADSASRRGQTGMAYPSPPKKKKKIK